MRYVRENLLVVASLLALGVALACWFLAPDPQAPSARGAAEVPWALPKVATSENSKSGEYINTRNLWGVVAANVPKAPGWTVMGLARSGGDRFVLVSVEGKPAMESLKQGDLLPDGTKIVQIDTDRFYVLTPEKKKVAFGIYKNDVVK